MTLGPMSGPSPIANNQAPVRSPNVGRTEKQEKASDRDANGQRMWEGPLEEQPEADETTDPTPPSDTPKSKDPTGASGGQLDLSG